MAVLITKFKYMKGSSEAKTGGYAWYIAKREGVELIGHSVDYKAETSRQHKFIQQILEDFPNSARCLEFEDYINDPNMVTASEFIDRAIEDNFSVMSNDKTYADYIATRPGVVRDGKHGLFSDKDKDVILKDVSREMNLHEGPVWTTIISLRRADAARLGFDKAERWRDMLRSQSEALSEKYHIPMNNLRWYAAFHDEGNHPHVHLIVYSKERNEGFITPQGIYDLRSAFANSIFADDLRTIYEKANLHRDELREEARHIVEDFVTAMNLGDYSNPVLEAKLTALSKKLATVSGKKVYGYLPQDTKAMVDDIVDEIAETERVRELYELWYEQREEIKKIYDDDLPERLPLSKNETFRAIHNAVIREAMRISQQPDEVYDEDMDEREVYEIQDGSISDMEMVSGYEFRPKSNVLPSWAVIRLMNSVTQIFENRVERNHSEGSGVDRKERRKIAEKKEALGMKQG